MASGVGDAGGLKAVGVRHTIFPERVRYGGKPKTSGVCFTTRTEGNGVDRRISMGGIAINTERKQVSDAICGVIIPAVSIGIIMGMYVRRRLGDSGTPIVSIVVCFLTVSYYGYGNRNNRIYNGIYAYLKFPNYQN